MQNILLERKQEKQYWQRLLDRQEVEARGHNAKLPTFSEYLATTLGKVQTRVGTAATVALAALAVIAFPFTLIAAALGFRSEKSRIGALNNAPRTAPIASPTYGFDVKTERTIK
ncbi:MAG: hypothetical protein V4490_01675, partial [Pseudomonadota bacterium]